MLRGVSNAREGQKILSFLFRPYWCAELAPTSPKLVETCILRTSRERGSRMFPLGMDLSCGCSSGCRGTRCGILAIYQLVEFPIVRDDRVETRAAVDLVDQPVGRSDGVVPIAAEELLLSSRKVHRGLRIYSVGAILTVHPVLAPLAAQAVVLEVFASGGAAVGSRRD